MNIVKDIQNANYTPIPTFARGRINRYLEERNLYEVNIYHSESGEFMGFVYCRLVYQPGVKDNYKEGDIVEVILTMIYGGVEPHTFHGMVQNGNNIILGKTDERVFINGRPFHPVTGHSDYFKFVHPKTGGGIAMTDEGMTTVATKGAVKMVLKPDGYGTDANLCQIDAQNFKRTISHNDPYLAKEHFGLYTGSDDEDVAKRLGPDDSNVIYRRFVTQTKDLVNWVSTCEGSWDPWVGANVDAEEVKKARDVLFTKIINSGPNRITIEAGEEGIGFYSFLVETIPLNERFNVGNQRATPAIGGQKFKAQVGDDGTFAVYAAGEAIPQVNKLGFVMKVDKDGNLRVQAKGKIVLTHGDYDDKINSITLDPAKGVDITAKNGFRVNGKQLLTEDFYAFLEKNQANWCQVTAVGAPAPLHPNVIAKLPVKKNSPMSGGGVLTHQVGPKALGLSMDLIAHRLSISP